MSSPTTESQYLDGRSRGFVYGPYLVTMAIDAAFFGLVLHLFLRWVHYSWNSDTMLIRVLVIWLMICSVAITVFILTYVMEVFAYNFGDFTVFQRLYWGPWFFLLETFVRTPVSLFFTERAYRMTGRSKIVLAAVLPLIVASFIGGVIARVELGNSVVNSNAGRFRAAAYLWNVTETVSDLILTIVIGVCLLRSKTGWRNTDTLINRLIVILMETQVPPTIVAFAFLIVFTVDSSSPLLAIFQWQSKIYIVSLLVVLNSRYKLSRDFGVEHGASIYPSAIKVTTETYVEAHRMDPMPNRQPPIEPVLRGEDEDYDDDFKIAPLSPASTARNRAVTFPEAIVLN